jgi:hypothetical protein
MDLQLMKTLPRLIAAAFVALIALSGSASAQSNPNWTYGYVPTPGQWNAEWGSKQDYLGSPPLLTSGGTMLGPLITAASTTLSAGLNLQPGVAPTSPQNGDLWVTTVGLYVRIAGTTIGPLTEGTSGSFTATTPLVVTFPGGGVVNYSLNFNTSLVKDGSNNLGINLAHSNVFSAVQTINLNAASLPAPLTGTILRVGQVDGTLGRFEIDSFGTNTPAILSGVVGRGTGASPTAVQSGDELASFNSWGYIGAGTLSSTAVAAVRTYASENFSTGHQGSQVCLATTPIASATLANSLCQNNTGGVTIGSPTGGDEGAGKLNVAGGYYVNGAPIAPTSGGANGQILQGVTSSAPVWTATPTLGASGTLGTLAFGNATSGTVTLQPATGALGSSVLSMPAFTDTLAVLAGAQAFTNKTYNGLTLTATTGTFTLTNAKTFSVSNTMTLAAGADGQTFTFPATSATIARTDAGQTFTGVDNFTAPVISGGSITGLTTFGIRSTGAAFDLILASTTAYTAPRTLTINLNDGNETFFLGGPLSFNAAFTTTGSGSAILAFPNITATYTFPTTTATLARTDAGQTFTGTNVFGILQGTSLALGGCTISTNALCVTGSTVLAATTVTGSFTATGLVTNGDLATMLTNTIKGNATSGTASPTDLSIGSCSTGSSALIWTTNTGFGCNTSITAAAVPASGLTGTTLASSVVTTSITTVGTLIGGATGAGFTVALTTSTVTGNLPCANTPALTGDVTTSAGSCATTVANITTGATVAGTLIHTNIAAPSTPTTGKVTVWSDSTDLRFHDKNSAGTIGTTVVASTASANNFATGISVAGVISYAQPAFSNLSGSATCAQLPALTGDITTSAGACATTLATVATAGTTGSSTAIPVITINTKGLTTTITTAAVIAPAGTLSGTTLNATVVTSSLTAVGTIGTGIWQGTAVALGFGGSGQSTVLGARGSSGFNIDEATSVGDTNGTISATDRSYFHTALTAARTDTLPAANSVNAGQILYLIDFRGVASATNTVTVQRAGSDTVNGGTSFTALNSAYGEANCWSDGSSRWTCSTGAGGGGGGVSSVTIAAGTQISVSGTCTITTSGTCTINLNSTTRTRQTFTSGSGTYTTPAGVRSIVVRLVGGGGGGSGTGNGSAGGNTTFGTSLLTGSGGAGSAAGGGATCTGGAATGGDINIVGGTSTAGTTANVSTMGLYGAAGPWGGAGANGYGYSGGSSSGIAASVNSGSGGGGGGTSSGATTLGGGGCAGGYVEKLIASPSATYSYGVGALGSGGTGGGNGGSGIIIVDEFYQ